MSKARFASCRSAAKVPGVLDFRHGDHVFRLEAGDSLVFDADAPHGPEWLVELPTLYLSIISYPQTS